MAAGLAVDNSSGDFSKLTNAQVAEAVVNRFFKNQAGGIATHAPLYTVKENVAEMRKTFEGAGVPRAAIRWDREAKHFNLALDGLSTDRAKDIAAAMTQFGDRSPGHAQWQDERKKEHGQEATLKAALNNEDVKSGKFADLKSHSYGAIVAQLTEAGYEKDVADGVATNYVSLSAVYGHEAKKTGAQAPSADDILKEAFEKVTGEQKDAGPAKEPVVAEEPVSENARRAALFNYVGSYGDGQTVDPTDKRSSPVPHPEVADTYVMNTVKDGAKREWTMRFADGTADPMTVAMDGKDPIFEQRARHALGMLAPYYGSFKTSFETNATRSPSDPHSIKIVAEDGHKKHAWDFAFEGGEVSKVSRIKCDGKDVAESTLAGAVHKPDTVGRSIAARLDHNRAKPDQTVIFVPMSERKEFEALRATITTPIKYDSKVDSGFGRPGGWVASGPLPEAFKKWQGAEAHAKFVKEGDEIRKGDRRLAEAAQTVVAEVNGNRFARYMGQGLKMPSDPVKKQQWIDGYTDTKTGRTHVGLKEATEQELKTMARLTSNSYQDLEKQESRIRLEHAVKRSDAWKARYEALPGSHEEKINGLLPRTAADGKAGFMALNHDQNRHLWKVNGAEMGLEQSDKLSLNSLNRGFTYLRERYEEVAGKPLGFSLTGVQTGVAEERTNVDTTSKTIGSDVSKAASLFGRARKHEDSGLEL